MSKIRSSVVEDWRECKLGSEDVNMRLDTGDINRQRRKEDIARRRKKRDEATGKTTCWMIDANHATTSREKERPAL
ncbi:hypothetical protein J6590_054324 [Homalodisca vitripennis]|nr:hypothetical protein J6590_054324 [Homalodisca vitripennis]